MPLAVTQLSRKCRMTEIELKLLLDARQERLLRSGPAVKQAAAGRAKTRNLHSIYFDTGDDALKRAAIALRLRRKGKRWLQTVKKSRKAIAQGLSTPLEDEVELPGPELDLERISDRALRDEVVALSKPGLSPRVETEFRRTSRLLSGPGGGKVELAIDIGEVRANGSSAPLAEAELEVKDGPAGDVFALARALVTQGPVRFSNRSKSERAGLLAGGGRAIDPPAPQQAAPPKLSRKATVEEAAVEVLNEIQHQVAANIVATVETDQIEGPHQLRIGLRRLRAALGAFHAALACDETNALGTRARDLGKLVGGLRDLDVLATELLPAAARDAPDEPGFVALAAAVSERRAATGREVRAALAGAEPAGFVLDLAGFVATRRWRAAGIGPKILDKPVRKLAARALDTRWKALRKCAKGIEDHSVEARHEMRKEIKKLRYVSETFACLYPKKRAEAFAAALKDLQQDFGALNDAAMAQQRLGAADAPGAGDPDAQRAAGRLIGAALAGAGHRWPRAIDDWRALKDLGPFWR